MSQARDTTIRDLTSRLEPRLAIETGTGYPFLQIDNPGTPDEIHLCRVVIRNLGLEPIHNVVVTATDIRLLHSTAPSLNVIGTPSVLHIMNDNVQPYTQSIQLGGEDRRFIDVMTAHLRMGEMLVQHAIPRLNILLQRSDSPFFVTIGATGNSIPSYSVQFEIGMENGQLYIRRVV